MLLISNKYEKISKYLNLDKPIIIFDCETTGMAISSDKIINIAYIKIFKEGHIKKDDIMLNPEMKIEPEATAIHGIRNRHVKDKPVFKEKAQELWDIFNGCYYSGFNITNFDLLILRREFIRVGFDFNYDVKDMVDTKKIFDHLSPRTLPLAYLYYCKKELKQSNSAMFDTEATAEILVKQLEKYKEIRNKEFLNKIHNESEDECFNSGNQKFYWADGEAYFLFSKYKNKSLEWVYKKDREFLEWMLGADFSADTKNIIRATIDKFKK
ncbi:3'-5' exonuclease [Candidatus Parcubacteria bacterium]|nr:3'-5' exonuclease [Candidatus Parcubacteria bacterium]